MGKYLDNKLIKSKIALKMNSDKNLKSRILAHRGLWNKQNFCLKNSKEALTSALKEGFGIETDIKNNSGELYISHDIIDEKENNLYRLEELLEYYSSGKFEGYLGINIKEDGLGSKLSMLINRYNIEKYFVFDMSIPEIFNIKKYIKNIFVRHSDYEDSYIFKEIYPKPKGIWLDSFKVNYDPLKEIKTLLNDWDNVAIVSPELHGRDPSICWGEMKSIYRKFEKESMLQKLFFCTDRPLEYYIHINELKM